MSSRSSQTSLAFLDGAGEMGERIRAFDWSRTSIGPLESWSAALRMMVRFMLANPYPMLLWWGPQYVSIYNDAYRPILGAKHPWALSRPVSEVWAEIWHILQPLIDTPFDGGPATWNEDMLFELNRHGFLEEGHFTIGYSPVPDETAPRGIGGVLATVHEITEKVVAERRVAVLRDLGARAGHAKTAEDACDFAAATFAAHDRDVPFALLYLVDAGRARFAAAAGVEIGAPLAPPVVDLARSSGDPWPLTEALASESLVTVKNLDERFTMPRGPWTDPPSTAVVVPIPSNRAHEPAALMVLGISARLKFDARYRDFVELVRIQIATAIANARAYEQEKRRSEALAEIDRAKTAFFSNVSHEFRTPLTLMLGPLEDALATPGVLSNKTAADLSIAHRSGLRLLRLVNTLLDFSRIEAGRIQAKYEPTDLAALTSDLASNFRSACEKAGLHLIVNCWPLRGADPVYVDRDMWEKIVLNLLSNAFKFTLEGQIELLLEPVDGQVRLTVRDTGVGIPPEELPRMFERFHRVKNSRGRTHEGTGIGLAFVHELVKLHGGTVRVDSVMGDGSTFTVTIPRGTNHLDPKRIERPVDLAPSSIGSIAFVEEALRWLPSPRLEGVDAESETPSVLIPALGIERPIVARLEPETGDEKPSRILWADDNADMRDYVARLLSLAGFEVQAVADGEAALAAARTGDPPEIVLSDVMMPRLDGYGLLRELRADPRLREIPVILLSARAGEESRIEGAQAGADDYLVKPFSARELVARVETHVKMARLRRETKESLRQRTEQFETLVRQAPIGVYLVDADFRLRAVNPVALPVFDDATGGVEGRDFDEIIHAMWNQDYADEVVRLFRHTLTTGEPYVTKERAERRRDRDVTEYYDWRIDRITLPDGRHGVVCYVRDVSERRQSEERLERLVESERAARADAERAGRIKDDFLATLSHELRTPLNAILGWSQLLSGGTPDPVAIEEGIRVIDRNARAQSNLIADLLDMSRITAGKLVLNVAEVSLDDVVVAAIDAVQPAADAKGVRIGFNAEAGNECVVRGDAGRLQQVVWNLLSNAIKFTPAGGRVEVGLKEAAGHAELVVSDSGGGMAPDLIPHVFERFLQGDASTSRHYGGLGLGLAIVKHLVELHGGTVSARSDGPGQGSTFTVRLPRAAAAAAPADAAPLFREAAQEPSGSAETLDLRGVRVLVVDDQPDACEVIRRMLEKRDAHVVTAASADEALSVIGEHRPHVVLCDIGMPEKDGYAFVEALRARGDQTPAVAVTAFARAEDRERALSAGYQAHVSKPVVEAQLLAAVASLTGRTRPAVASAEGSAS